MRQRALKGSKGEGASLGVSRRLMIQQVEDTESGSPKTGFKSKVEIVDVVDLNQVYGMSTEATKKIEREGIKDGRKTAAAGQGIGGRTDWAAA